LADDRLDLCFDHVGDRVMSGGMLSASHTLDPASKRALK
jgi:hypothetical protein